MAMRRSGDMIEDIGIIGGLIGMQFLLAGNAVFVSYLMSMGVSSLAIVIFLSFATFFVLLPFASYFERSKWPKMWRLKLIIKVLFLALGGVTLFQSLFLKGMNLTSPTMATAMPNLAPGLIFVIASTFRLEKVDLSCTYSRVKILGTMLCVLGAITMSIMQSVSSPKTAKEIAAQLPVTTVPPPPDVIFDENKIVGCLYLLAAVLILSSTTVLQAFTLAEFPAPMSLSAVTSFFGGFMTAILQLLEEHELKAGWPLVTLGHFLGYSVLAGAMSGTCLSFTNWALRKRGPVLVSMFTPISTVCSVVFSVVTLGDTFNIVSLVCMLLMFTGLYLVLWAKSKEGYVNIGSESEAEKPLLT